jgi:hypothetical protein
VLDGFKLASASQKVCKAKQMKSSFKIKPVVYIPDKRLVYCPTEKVGTTFWKRTLYMLDIREPAKYKQPYDVPIKAADEWYSKSRKDKKRSMNLLSNNEKFRFLFVRDPFSRLLSVYIDKLVPPNPTFWESFGRKAISKFRPFSDKVKNFFKHAYFKSDGHDVTFAENLKFVTDEEKNNKGIDPHIKSVYNGCKPCTYDYTFVGRMETFKTDAFYIMKRVEMNSSLAFLKDSFSEMALDDAITDSIRSPFSWKDDVIKYITWEKALQRIWLKLQMRGIIESKIKPDIQKTDVDKITADQFIEMARKAHKLSNPVELKKQKERVKREAFASVPLSDIVEYVETFRQDFDLFGYDRSPSYIFDREEDAFPPTEFFNYDHLN